MSREILADGLSIANSESGFHLTYTDEASVRRALARLARALGWAVVREEVVIPGWGRIDLLLRARSEDSIPYLVEIKLDLSKPANVRRAFQQVDGYGRWWEMQHGGPSYPILTSCTGSAELILSVGDAYPAVRYASVQRLMTTLLMGIASSPADRLGIARARLEQAEKELQIQRRAVDLLVVVADTVLAVQDR